MSSRHWHRDYETRSVIDLKKTGARAYMQHPTTSIWCCAYAFDEDPIKLWAPSQSVPAEIVEAALLGDVEAWAHNCAFETMVENYIAGPRHGFPVFEPTAQRCTMVGALAMALPAALENVAPALGLAQRKDMIGQRLMKQMAKPRKIELAAGFDEIPYTAVRVAEMDNDGWEVYEDGRGRLVARVRWWNDPEKIERLKLYCADDVAVERGVGKRIRPLSESELALWHLDQTVNRRGVLVDQNLCHSAKGIVAEAQKALDAKMRTLTDGDVTACSNRNQLVKWVRAQGVECDSVAKAAMEELLSEDSPIPSHVREVLLVRQEAAKASVSKIDALLRGISPDTGNACDLLQFHAASTGRWGGRRFQPQNLVRPEHVEAVIEILIDCILAGDTEMLDMLGIPWLTAVAQTLRGMLTARPGRRIVASDLSNIEGRVLAWLAGEDWKLQAFRDFDAGIGPDIYIRSYADAFKTELFNKKDPRRQIGKVMELAFGYQGGYGAWMNFATGEAAEYSRERIDEIKNAWRDAHANTRQFWYDIENAAVEAVREKGSVQSVGRIRFKMAGSFLFARLPSGRFICYPYPELRQMEMPWNNSDGSPAYKSGLTYMTVPDVSKRAKIVPDDRNSSSWARVKTYGGELTNNVTQATARDVMKHGMFGLEAAGYPIILTVHDEIVCEVPIGHGSVEEMESIMCDLPDWAAGLPVAAEGFEGERYRK